MQEGDHQLTPPPAETARGFIFVMQKYRSVGNAVSTVASYFLMAVS